MRPDLANDFDTGVPSLEIEDRLVPHPRRIGLGLPGHEAELSLRMRKWGEKENQKRDEEAQHRRARQPSYTTHRLGHPRYI